VDRIFRKTLNAPFIASVEKYWGIFGHKIVRIYQISLHFFKFLQKFIDFYLRRNCLGSPNAKWSIGICSNHSSVHLYLDGSDLSGGNLADLLATKLIGSRRNHPPAMTE
jgi:hypothetical protein